MSPPMVDVQRSPDPSPATPCGADLTTCARLLRDVQSGDRNAMDELLSRARPAAYRFGSAMCGSDGSADDVVQDALLNLYLHASRIRAPDAFEAWLYRTVRNAFLMSRRKRVNEPRALDSLDHRGARDTRPREPADPAADPERRAILAAFRRHLLAAIRRLPPAYRAVVILRGVRGLSTDEASRALGITQASVKTLLRRARLRLEASTGPSSTSRVRA